MDTVVQSRLSKDEEDTKVCNFSPGGRTHTQAV